MTLILVTAFRTRNGLPTEIASAACDFIGEFKDTHFKRRANGNSASRAPERSMPMRIRERNATRGDELRISEPG